MNRDPRRLRIILALLVLTAFTLVTLDYRAGKSGPLSTLRNAVGDVFGPVESGLTTVFRPVGHFFGDLGHAGSQGDRVRTLQQQVATLQAQLRTQADAAVAQRQLGQLLTFAAGQRFAIIPARVVAIGDASGFDDAVTLDIGSADGVRAEMTVIAGTTRGGGLVGRVVAVGPHTATVAVVTDPDVHVGSRLASADLQSGITSGHGLAPLTFTPTDPSVRPARGQVVETLGSGQYAPGIPVGTVTSIGPTPGLTTVTAQLTPFFDYDGLDVVGVVAVPATGRAAGPVLPTVTVSTRVTVTRTPAPSVPPGGSTPAASTAATPTSSRRP